MGHGFQLGVLGPHRLVVLLERYHWNHGNGKSPNLSYIRSHPRKQAPHFCWISGAKCLIPGKTTVEVCLESGYPWAPQNPVVKNIRSPVQTATNIGKIRHVQTHFQTHPHIMGWSNISHESSYYPH